MKVVKSGKTKKAYEVPKWVGRNAMCKLCGCIVQLEASDNPYTKMEHGKNMGEFLHCPECMTSNKLPGAE